MHEVYSSLKFLPADSQSMCITDITVFLIANQDYTPATNAVIFPATASIVCTSFGIIDDDVQEDPERFCVDFEVQPLMFDVPVEKVVAVSTVTIIDDERKLF